MIDEKRYSEYLDSDWWQKNRAPVIQRANGQCECCRKKIPLVVHHLTYRHIGYEEPDELIALCPACHEWIEAQKHAEGYLPAEEQLSLLHDHARALSGVKVPSKEAFIRECVEVDISNGGKWNMTKYKECQAYFDEYCKETGWNGGKYHRAPALDVQSTVARVRWGIILDLLDQGLSKRQIQKRTGFSSKMISKVAEDADKHREWVRQYERDNHSTN